MDEDYENIDLYSLKDYVKYLEQLKEYYRNGRVVPEKNVIDKMHNNRLQLKYKNVKENLERIKSFVERKDE